MTIELTDQNTEDALAPISIEDEVADFLTDSIEDTLEFQEPANTDNVEIQSTEPVGETPEGEASAEVVNQDTQVPEVVQEVKPPEEASELDTLRAQIASLTTLVDTLSAPKETPKVSLDPDLGLEELIAGVDFDEIMESKENFMKFFTQALRAVSMATTAHIRGEVPEIITQHASMNAVANDFYSAHPELSGVKQYVVAVANSIAAEHPDWQVAQVLTEAAKVSKAALNIQEVRASSPTPSPAPVLPGGNRGSRVPAKQVGQLQSEIDDFLDD